MPIRFRCDYCNKLLGIARRKAGAETTCPHCGYTITVPVPAEPEGDASTQTNLNDLSDLLNLASPTVNADPEFNFTSPPAPSPPPAPARPAAPSAPTVAAKPVAAPARPARPPSGERPLFERDLDAVLGLSNKAGERREEPKHKPPPPTSGMDARNLGTEDGQVVLSSQKATAVIVAFVLLLGLSFAAGFLIASR